MYFLQLLLQFYSRKIFLDYLGTEILGLNTTASNLLQFLNLAELGVGSAIAFTLYKPIFDKDENSLNEILTLQGWYYKKVAYFLIIGSGILMFFFPMIFKKITLPLTYAYASFSVLLFSSLLGYFTNYRQVLLSADQKDYKIQYSYRLINLIKIVIQIIAVANLSHPYFWWLLLEVIFSIVSAFSLNIVLHKTYPFLRKSPLPSKILRQKYPDLLTKVKQLFLHKIGTFALSQTSPLIIYAFTTLTTVALYGNYLIITNGCALLISSLFNSVGGGVGNLIASGDKNRIWSVFKELFGLRYVLIISLCFVVYEITPLFINFWVGEQYLLSQMTLLIMLGNFYIMCSRLTVDNFINGFGLFGDIWSPVCEAILNIGCSLLLGSYFGLNGVISGVFISLFFTMIVWKPYYLFTRKMKGFYKMYLTLYVKNIVVSALSLFLIKLFLTYIYIPIIHNLFETIIYAILLMISVTSILIITSVVFKCGIELFLQRIKLIIQR